MDEKDDYIPRESIPAKWWIRDYVDALTRPFTQFQVWSFETRLLAKLRGQP